MPTGSYEERIRQRHAANSAKAEHDAAERKMKIAAEKKNAAEKSKQRAALFKKNLNASIIDRVNNRTNRAKKPEPKTTRKTIGKTKVPKSATPTNPRQREAIEAELESDSDDAASVLHDITPSPVPASAPGDVLDHDVEPLASEHMNPENNTQDVEPLSSEHVNEEIDTQDPCAAGDTYTLRQKIYDGVPLLTESHLEKFIDLLNLYCNWDINLGDEVEIDDISDGRLMILPTFAGEKSKHREANEGTRDHSDDQARVTQSEIDQTQRETGNSTKSSSAQHKDEQSHTGPSSPPTSDQIEQTQHQHEEPKSSALEDSVNKNGKRRLDNEDDDEATSGLFDVHMHKRARSLDSYSNPREKHAHVAKRGSFLYEHTMPSSTKTSTAVNVASIDAGLIPTVTGWMIPFGAGGNANLKYKHVQEQLSAESVAMLAKQGAAKQVQKRRASEAQLPEQISQSMAKKLKQSHEERALRDEIQQATEKSTAEVKPMKQDEVVNTPELTSASGDKNVQMVDHPSAIFASTGATTDEEASAIKPKSSSKDHVDSKNVEANESSSSSTDANPSDEKSAQKATGKISKTDTSPNNTSTPTSEPVAYEEATQVHNKTSQATDEQPAESPIVLAATTTAKQEQAVHSEQAKPTSKTQDGQKSAKTKASGAPTSTTASGTATTTEKQQTTAHNSKKHNGQNGVAKAGKKTTDNSNNTNTDDKAQSANANSITKKTVTKTKTKTKNDSDQDAVMSKKTSTKSASSASDTKPASKTSTAKQPAAGTSTGTGRFHLTEKSDVKRPVARKNPSQATTQNQPTTVNKLTDKTNTHGQRTNNLPGKTTTSGSKKQPEATEEQHTPARPVSSKKSSRDEVESVEKTAKMSRPNNPAKSSANKKRSLDEDDGADNTKKPAKKQRIRALPTPAPEVNATSSDSRPSRSRAAAQRNAAAASAAPAARRLTEQALAQWFEGPEFGDGDEGSDDEAQPATSAKENERNECKDRDDQKINEDEAQQGVEEQPSSDTGSAEDVPATDADMPAPQKKRKQGVAYPPGEEPKRRAAKPRVLSAAAQERRVRNKLIK